MTCPNRNKTKRGWARNVTDSQKTPPKKNTKKKRKPKPKAKPNSEKTPYEQLTTKQKIFVDRYLNHKNAKRAALEAGYSERNAEKIGPETLARTRVKQVVEAELAKLREHNRLTADWVIKRLMAIADTHVEEVVDLKDWRVRDDKEVDRMKLLAVSGIEQSDIDSGKFSKVERKVKLADKTRALKMLGDYLGKQFIFTPEDGSKDRQKNRESGLSALPEIIAKYEGERPRK